MDVAVINGKRAYGFVSTGELLDFIEGKKGLLVALNPEKLNRNEPLLDQIINNHIGYPDGIGAVFALRLRGVKAIRITGADFWLDIIKNNYKSKSFYLIGARQDVLEATVARLKKEYPKIEIKGWRNGYFKHEEINTIAEEIKATEPDFVFVAMGSPRQEYLMNELFGQFDKALYMGLGGSYDVYSGSKKRAPKVLQVLGLEWFYRLASEPSRWRRQTSLFVFLYRLLLKRI
ncbi:UDP-N-acetyl-D-mannosaminouronate:lipid I N-acetyl-D-mannosaminouronosyltransferase [Anseongella ginsenosidimutans]|uniref:UDP-N-acetyl-D-mannosaminouronate:lipid I N-acetyl-D-mannosaminouronosyltransferase n=1 Tax=Anseongella ginsenosidimutans TaxID=496056 RepID=A0A4R3KM52_9SPHI|nr:WecB/TagA/CpsF family glycosyltransferase [Anseongella ginsenosidimutans]QEC52144.1 WecB/TagA/CpsF family glycosyltransferase [Anseongella ginsenosidimutans]TCS84827.1 UDP-N-acetyl-D-mannosaminouronate:lipid I N-acetyl-D-mannosaminouronosyltransferase [Anseongella ginsenosidimutans]